VTQAAERARRVRRSHVSRAVEVKGGEPIFIDWQYASPGQGIEDLVFLLVEGCEITNFKLLADSLMNAYDDERQKLDDVEMPSSERCVQMSCALAGFPFFVAV